MNKTHGNLLGGRGRGNTSSSQIQGSLLGGSGGTASSSQIQGTSLLGPNPLTVSISNPPSLLSLQEHGAPHAQLGPNSAFDYSETQQIGDLEDNESRATFVSQMDIEEPQSSTVTVKNSCTVQRILKYLIACVFFGILICIAALHYTNGNGNGSSNNNHDIQENVHVPPIYAPEEDSKAFPSEASAEGFPSDKSFTPDAVAGGPTNKKTPASMPPNFADSSESPLSPSIGVSTYSPQFQRSLTPAVFDSIAPQQHQQLTIDPSAMTQQPLASDNPTLQTALPSEGPSNTPQKQMSESPTDTVSPSNTPSNTPSDTPIFQINQKQIQLIKDGKCLTNNYFHGPVLDTCNGDPVQLWNYDSGSKQITTDNGINCLGYNIFPANWLEPSEYYDVYLLQCDNNDLMQKWIILGDQIQVVGDDNKCLCFVENTDLYMSLRRLVDCNSDDSHQKWMISPRYSEPPTVHTVSPSDTPTAQINYEEIQAYDGTCIEFMTGETPRYESGGSHTLLTLNSCNGGSNQIWYHNIETQQIIHAHTGYCLNTCDLGSTVDAAECDNSDTQKWKVAGEKIFSDTQEWKRWKCLMVSSDGDVKRPYLSDCYRRGWRPKNYPGQMWKFIPKETTLSPGN